MGADPPLGRRDVGPYDRCVSTAPAALQPVYLIQGEDRAKIERAVQRLVTRVRADGGMDPDRFRAPDDAAQDVAMACATLSFGGTRLVICLDVDEWRAADVEPLLEYLVDPNPQTVLALVAARAPAQKLTQAVQKAGQVLAYGMPAKANRREQREWFARHLAAEVQRFGASIGDRAAGQVVDLLGGVTDETKSWLALALSQEAAKLAAASGGEPIERELVELMVVGHPDAPAYALADALARGDRDAFETLADAAARGDSRTSPTALQFSATRHFRAVAAVQDAEGGPEAASSVGGLHGFPAQRAAEHASLMPRRSAATVVARLAQLEIDLRVSAFARLGRSPGDGGAFCWEIALLDCLSAARSGEPTATRR